MNISDYKFKTELHAHTNPASPCSDFTPEDVIQRYRDIGYDSIVISNHFYPGMRFLGEKKKCIEAYLRDYEESLAAGRKYGINVIFGCELRFTENINDYLIYGIDPEFADFAYDSMPKGLEEFSKNFRSEEHLIIQAHPYRDGMTEMPSGLIDGVEAFNLHPGHNSRVALAARYAQKNNLIVTCGSDFHHEVHQGTAAFLTKTEVKSSRDIVDAIRNGAYLLEVGGYKLLP